MGRLVLKGFPSEFPWATNVVNLSHWIKWCGGEACDSGWLYVRDSGDDTAQGKTVQREGRDPRIGPPSNICSWSHPGSLQSQIPHFISTSLRTPFHLTSSSTFTSSLTSLRPWGPWPYLFQDVHSLPYRSNLCTSFPNCSMSTTSSSKHNVLLLLLLDLFLNLYSPNSPTGHSRFS